MTSKEKRIADIMKKLNCTAEEALDVLETDKAIDKGAKPFELTEQQKKVSKQSRQIARKPREQTNKAKREDSEKQEFMRKLVKFLETSGASDVVVTNPERQVDFKLPHVDKDGNNTVRKHRIVFSAPRK